MAYTGYVSIGSATVFHNTARWEATKTYKVTAAERGELVGIAGAGITDTSSVADSATENVAWWKRVQGLAAYTPTGSEDFLLKGHSPKARS